MSALSMWEQGGVSFLMHTPPKYLYGAERGCSLWKSIFR